MCAEYAVGIRFGIVSKGVSKPKWNCDYTRKSEMGEHYS